MKKHIMKFAYTLLVVGLLGSWTACPHPIPGGPGPIAHIIDCSKQAIGDRGISLIPVINTCLTGGSVTTCLLGLLDPVVGITEDMIACLVRGRGAEYAAAAQANPSDSISAGAMVNATQFLTDRQITFKE